MVKVLNSVITKLRVMTNNEVETALEWPRRPSGWQEPTVQALCRTMPVSCAFNGCMYGICDGNEKLQKPFRV
eukprot:14538809-Heterocapsa_arctica.AAC.1